MGEEALELLGRFRGVGVLCLGDMMLDRYIYGSAERISPEAPVPVVHVRRQVLAPGGIGNVVNNLCAFTVTPSAVSVAGDDEYAGVLDGFFAGGKCAAFHLVRDAERPTTVKTRVIAGIQQVVRFDEEKPEPLSDAAAARLLDAAESLMAGVDAVALSDYGKGVLTPRIAQAVIGMATARGIGVAIDPKGRDYAKYAGATLVKPNRKELAEVSGASVSTDAEVAEAARTLMRRHSIRNMLVTLSERGMMLLREGDGGAEPVMLPSRAREVFDVTGAGDTVLAGMTAAMAVRAPLELGARLSTLAAGVVVGKVGTAVAHVEDIERAVREEG